jgi:TetR/AcrR family transcriptional regulator, mexJK operon transcriptional repressor
MDEIARRAGSSTQTIYARYPGKLDVLKAVVMRLEDRRPNHRPLDPAEIEPREYLMKAGRSVLASFSRGAIGINRLAMSEAHHIPDLRLVAAHGFGRGVENLRDAFAWWRDHGVLDVKGDLERVATICMSMMSDRPRIRVVMGDPMSPEESEAYVAQAVDIFLHGCTNTKR